MNCRRVGSHSLFDLAEEAFAGDLPPFLMLLVLGECGAGLVWTYLDVFLFVYFCFPGHVCDRLYYSNIL